MRKTASTRTLFGRRGRPQKTKEPISQRVPMKSYRNTGTTRKTKRTSNNQQSRVDEGKSEREKQYDMFREMYANGFDAKTIEVTMRDAGLDPFLVLPQEETSHGSKLLKKSAQSSPHPTTTLQRDSTNNVSRKTIRKKVKKKKNRNPISSRRLSANHEKTSTLPLNNSQPMEEQTPSVVGSRQGSYGGSYTTRRQPSFNEINISEVASVISTRDKEEGVVGSSRSVVSRVLAPNAFQNELQKSLSRRNMKTDSPKNVLMANQFNRLPTYNSASGQEDDPRISNRSVANSVMSPRQQIYKKGVTPVKSSRSIIQRETGSRKQDTMLSRSSGRTFLKREKLDNSDSKASRSSRKTFLKRENLSKEQNQIKNPSSNSRVFKGSRSFEDSGRRNGKTLMRKGKGFIKREDNARNDSVPSIPSICQSVSLNQSQERYVEQHYQPQSYSNMHRTKQRDTRKNSEEHASFSTSANKSTKVEKKTEVSVYRPVSQRPEKQVAPTSNMMAFAPTRLKNGVQLRMFPYDNEVYIPFKAMQISKVPPRVIVAALERSGLDPIVLYRRLDIHRKPNDPIEVEEDAQTWDLKYSKRYMQHYYQNRQTGEILWKDEVEKINAGHNVSQPQRQIQPPPPANNFGFNNIDITDDDF